MKQRKFITSLFSLVFFICIIPAYRGFCQVYSEGINKEAKKLGYLELKIIDVDPILNQAKETAPFDKPFFLKVKRRTVEKASTTTLTRTITKTVGDTTTTLKIEQAPIAGQPATQSASIKEVNLSLLNDHKHSVVINAQSFYQEDKDSDFVYIQIDNVKPEHGYQLTVIWDVTGEQHDEKYYFTTVAPTLDKRLKNKISPQIGITSVLFKLPDKSILILPRLMVGAYYQLRPIDPDIPYKSYHPWALQRVSAYLGLTFNTLADGNIREDLFGTSNLLLGIGYQPIDALRITAGHLFFTELDPNRIVADRRSTASTLYIGITLDVKLKDLLGGIITTLGFK